MIVQTTLIWALLAVNISACLPSPSLTPETRTSSAHRRPPPRNLHYTSSKANNTEQSHLFLFSHHSHLSGAPFLRLPCLPCLLSVSFFVPFCVWPSPPRSLRFLWSPLFLPGRLVAHGWRFVPAFFSLLSFSSLLLCAAARQRGWGPEER
jgi:hypothetical protein